MISAFYGAMASTNPVVVIALAGGVVITLWLATRGNGRGTRQG